TDLVAGLGKIPVAWHEASAASRLAPATIGQHWVFVTPTGGRDDKARAFIARGGQLIPSLADIDLLAFPASSPPPKPHGRPPSARARCARGNRSPLE
ncbi:hypothetical protein, partial [Pseudomonas sp. PS02285]|uniref:hypothetical protein n=1 Tax=Pseudomonas sp. PS02285 TaxID=2991441 RepID=UPI00249AEC55